MDNKHTCPQCKKQYTWNWDSDALETAASLVAWQEYCTVKGKEVHEAFCSCGQCLAVSLTDDRGQSIFFHTTE